MGRIVGKALVEGHLVKIHFTRLLYKHMLGWPVNSKDIPDDQLYSSLAYLWRAKEIPCGLNFTTSEEVFGKVIERELVEGGSNISVTGDNMNDFLGHCVGYHLLEKTLPQLTELLLGFFDVVPEPALTVFDPSELELVLCGLPHIPVDDWRKATVYRGLFKRNGERHPTVKWFWQVVQEFDMETRARLLQLTTGTSGVPPGGFQHLRAGNGTIKLFTIHGFLAQSSQDFFPRVRTCFNRLDLPLYSSKDELRRFLVGSLTSSIVGFDTE